MATNNVSTSLRSASADSPANRPAFFIVGAPRSGTTALSDFLGQHPELYISYVKEPHYFGSDLNLARGFPTQADYFHLFRDAGERLCGEASTWYLYSQHAAQEIHAFNPDAKIIIMLRNPADMVYSWYGHVRLTGEETIESFEDALRAEEARRQGARIPRGTPVHKLLYTEIPLYTEQIKRFHAVFGPENVRIIVYDDFKADQRAVVQETFAFLGVDASFEPAFSVVNAHGQTKSKTVQNLMQRPPGAVRRLVRTVIPTKLRAQLRHTIRQMNTQLGEREQLSPELRKHLNGIFAPEVRRLSEFLQRDLTHWTRDEE